MPFPDEQRGPVYPPNQAERDREFNDRLRNMTAEQFEMMLNSPGFKAILNNVPNVVEAIFGAKS